jgi:hypothetical protein
VTTVASVQGKNTEHRIQNSGAYLLRTHELSTDHRPPFAVRRSLLGFEI